MWLHKGCLTASPNNKRDTAMLLKSNTPILLAAIAAAAIGLVPVAAVYGQQPEQQLEQQPEQQPAQQPASQPAESMVSAVPAAEPAFRPQPRNPDPWEGMNRGVYGFNNFFDGIIVRPTARVYQTIIPGFIRRGIRNFFSNLFEVNTMANNTLQGKFGDAVSDSGRLLINSTLGIGGIFDVATGMGLEKHQEDFGQTLAVWGAGPGPYMMLPVFGASNLRDSFGLTFDYGFDPVQYHEDLATRSALFILEQVDNRERLLGLDELVVGDEYLFIRDAYIQNREYLIKDGQVENTFDDFGEPDN